MTAEMRFCVLLAALSAPFWLAGTFVGDIPGMPMNLPVSSFMIFATLGAAVILVYREEGAGSVRRLLLRSVDPRTIRPPAWYAPALLLMPAVLLLSYAVARATGQPLPAPQAAAPAVPVLFLVYVLAAACEEVAWMGYLAPRMLPRWGVLRTGVLMGTLWALWHIIPYLQMGRTWEWIGWQALFTVAARVLIVWLYESAGQSVFAAVLVHATSNLGVTLYPVNGSHYDPAVTGCITAAVAVCALWLRPPKERSHSVTGVAHLD
ncbi:membrane protease YdiL (CAAX protease family) [Symbiobacterium terraclitae]|uniref:Membrane protease YdiL (CAAX protease family) n=1 Tax=Symbiobacterium terraclitae TaxID=557451 RepID=A0ABS4JUG3_9FIRM|nr:membrane protease YdiL (CAAX protease family) [Symbiobacterium terraclitae]